MEPRDCTVVEVNRDKRDRDSLASSSRSRRSVDDSARKARQVDYVVIACGALVIREPKFAFRPRSGVRPNGAVEAAGQLAKPLRDDSAQLWPGAWLR
jgi:hypothetical protein